MNQLISILEEIGAHDYATIEKEYGEPLWRRCIALENDEINENEFTSLIEKADDAYYKLNGKLEALLEDYFVKIHTELIETIDDWNIKNY